jgi:hypothetical protein
MLDWLLELFQPILTAIMSLLVWLGLVSPHKDVSVSGASISETSISEASVVSEHVLPESEQYGAALLGKPSEEAPVPSNE